MQSDVRDKPYSWVVAVAGCLMYFIMNGLSRTTGLLFVEILVYFDTDRETAAFPFTLACALRYLAGPIAGALAGRLGLRLVILLGSIMACIGVGGCYLATSITAISVLWGGFFGLGSGISSLQLPQILNLYFTKHLTTANGLAYAGTAIAGFVVPPIMEILLNEYGMAGTYLLLSGIALHAIPAAILLKEPENEKLPMISFEIPDEIRENYKRRISSISIFYDSTKIRARRLSRRFTLHTLGVGTTLPLNGDNSEIEISKKRYSFFTTSKSIYSFNHSNESTIGENPSLYSFSESIFQNKNASDGCVNSNIQNNNSFKMKKAASLSQIKVVKPLEVKNTVIITEPISIAYSESLFSKGKYNSLSRPGKDDSLPNIKENEPLETKCYNVPAETTEDSEKHEQPPNMCLNDISIFWNLKFFLINFTASINSFVSSVVPTILIDFCTDKGISTIDATYILMAFSIFDMVGRVGFGWVTDGKFMSRANFSAVCFFACTVSLPFFVWSTGLIPMFFVLSILGLSLGVHTPLPTGLVVEYIDESKHTMANASVDVLSVPFLLLTPAMIGYFRDDLGSYDLFVYLLCVISLVCALMMMLLPFIQRREQEKKATASQ